MAQVLSLEEEKSSKTSWPSRMKKWILGINDKVNEKLSTVQVLMTIKTAVEHSMDIVKDVLILIQISMAQGGFLFMMSQEKPYIKGVKPLFLLSKCFKYALTFSI